MINACKFFLVTPLPCQAWLKVGWRTIPEESLPMPKRYSFDLTPGERAQLVALRRKGKASARQVTRGHILLHPEAVAEAATVGSGRPRPGTSFTPREPAGVSYVGQC